MTSFRSDRLSVLLKKTLADIINRDFDPEGALITITEVDLDQSQSHAKVGVSIMPKEKTEFIMKKIKSWQGNFQNQLIKKLKMRYVPRIDFFSDEGPDNAARIEKLLNNS